MDVDVRPQRVRSTVVFSFLKRCISFWRLPLFGIGELSYVRPFLSALT